MQDFNSSIAPESRYPDLVSVEILPAWILKFQIYMQAFPDNMFQKNVNPKASSSCDRMQEMLDHSHITKQRNNSELLGERGRASYFAVLSVNCLCILFIPRKLQTLLKHT